MHDTSARLVERVLPAASYRQWVLTVPFPLRLRIASRVAGRLGIGPTLLLGQLLMVGNVALLAATLVVPAAAFPLLLLSSFVLGLGASYYNVTLYSMRQAITPAPLRGRTVASVRLRTG